MVWTHNSEIYRTHALVGGFISASMLPLGALLGICVEEGQLDTPMAMMVALAAGALLFVVSIELYSDSLTEMELHGFAGGGPIEIFFMISGALLGTCAYIAVNRWLDARVLVETYGDFDDLGTESYGAVDQDKEAVAFSPFASTREAGEPLVLHMPDTPDEVQRRGLTPEEQKSGSRSPHVFSSKVRSVTPRLSSTRPKCLPLTQQDVEGLHGGKKAVLGILARRGHHTGSTSREASPSSGHPEDALGSTHRSTASSTHLVPQAPPHQHVTLVSPRGDGTSGPMGSAMWFKSFSVEVTVWGLVLVDGLPESVLIGYLAADGNLSVALVTCLLLANFPEGFASGMVLRKAGVSTARILLLWTAVAIIMGGMAWLTCTMLPQSMLMWSDEYRLDQLWLRLLGGTLEGMAGGAMLSSISNVMLPSAYGKLQQGDLIGLFVLIGFLFGMCMKVLEGIYVEIMSGKSASL